MDKNYKILVVDTCSLINFLYYYYFDKNNGKTLYEKLFNFLITKIELGEIVIMDKVFDELKVNNHNKELKKRVQPFIVDTLFLFDEVGKLISNYTNHYAEKIFKDSAQKDIELKKYEETIADLYLVAYSKHIKKDNVPLLITEENKKSDGKLIEKIPTICIKEKIEYRNIPYSLFEIYKDELKFELNVL